VTEQGKRDQTRLYVRLAPAMFVVGLGFMLSQVFSNAGPASADDPNGKVRICHATGSSTNPFVLITVDEHAGPAHLGGPNVNGNGNVDHKGHGDILLNPGSVNAGTIGHGPITAAECKQLAGGAATTAPIPPSKTEAAEPDQAISDEPEDIRRNIIATDEAEDLPGPGHGHESESTMPTNSGVPPARGNSQPTTMHPTDNGHESTGGLTQHQTILQGGAGSPAAGSPPLPGGSTVSTNNTNAGKTNQPNGATGSKPNGGANAAKPPSSGPSQHDAGGNQPAGKPNNQGGHH